jgi:hypothetical protein
LKRRQGLKKRPGVEDEAGFGETGLGLEEKAGFGRGGRV